MVRLFPGITVVVNAHCLFPVWHRLHGCKGTFCIIIVILLLKMIFHKEHYGKSYIKFAVISSECIIFKSGKHYDKTL